MNYFFWLKWAFSVLLDLCPCMCHFFIVETDFFPLFWAQLHCCLIQETVSSMWASHLTMYLQEMNRTPTAGTLQHIPKILSSTLQLYHSDKTGSRVYVICSRSHTQDHCSISLLLSHSHFSFLFLFFLFFAESRLITSLSLFPLLWSSLIFLPPAASSPPLYLFPLLPTCLSVRNWSNVLIEAPGRDGNF